MLLSAYEALGAWLKSSELAIGCTGCAGFLLSSALLAGGLILREENLKRPTERTKRGGLAIAALNLLQGAAAAVMLSLLATSTGTGKDVLFAAALETLLALGIGAFGMAAALRARPVA
jgi:hypothetical protein